MTRRSASATFALGSLACLLAPVPASPQQPEFDGGEFQVNHVTSNNQLTATRRAVAVEGNGDFVVVWTSVGQDGSGESVFGQRFASSGARIGIEFRVNTYTPGDQGRPGVASDADGDFVVVWNSNYQDNYQQGVFARRFSSAGSALATEFQVTLGTIGNQLDPAVAVDSDGDFVVAWGGLPGLYADIRFRRFDSAGAALGGDFIANTATVDVQGHPAVDMDGSGGFAIAWESGNGVVSSAVFARIFDSSGMAAGAEFQVNVNTTGGKSRPALGRAGNGDFVVAWQSEGQDGSVYGVFARQFDAGGTPRADEFQVNVYAYGGQYQPAVEVDASGDFVIAWESNSQEPAGGSGIFMRGFDESGAPTSGEIHGNMTITGNQVLAALGGSPDGHFVVAWSSNGQDGSGYGVIARRFHVPSVLDVDGNGQLTALTDGLLLLRFFFGFTGSTLTAGAVGPNCTRCDGAEILAYLQSLA